jgi:hypothetical protein
MVPSFSGYRQQLTARPCHVTTKLRDVTTHNNVSHTQRLAKTNYLNASVFSLGFDPLIGRTRPSHVSCSVTIRYKYRNLDIVSVFKGRGVVGDPALRSAQKLCVRCGYVSGSDVE